MRIGRQEPTLRICEPYSETYGGECAEFCEAGGLRLLEWQRNILDDWLARGPDGHWLSQTIGTMVNRQNGKSEGCLVARVAYGVLVLGERVIVTSHRQDASTQFYRQLTALLGSSAYREFVDPDFFRGALGREEVPVKDGNSVSFIARSNRGGRARHADLLVIDEAQFLTDDELDALMPTQLTSGDIQIIETGTMPSYRADGGVFRRDRRAALDGAPGVYWAEWGVGEEFPEDVGDRDLWYEANPSLGLLIPERNMEALYRKLTPEGFACECLGWLAPAAGGGEAPAIDPEAWDRCETGDPPKGGVVACGVKFSSDGSTYSVSVAAKQPDGTALVECVDRAGTSGGVAGLARWISARRATLAMVCVDGQQWAPTLTQRLSDLGFPKAAVKVMRAHDLADACAMLANAVGEGAVCHIAQPMLRASVATSTRRPIGAYGWGFGGEDPTPVESCAMAYWAAMGTKRNPNRKMRVGI